MISLVMLCSSADNKLQSTGISMVLHVLMIGVPALGIEGDIVAAELVIATYPAIDVDGIKIGLLLATAWVTFFSPFLDVASVISSP